jgi:hypothetical protein
LFLKILIIALTLIECSRWFWNRNNAQLAFVQQVDKRLPWNWSIPSESIPGEKWFEHPRKYYIQYWKDHGVPEGFVRKNNDLSN